MRTNNLCVFKKNKWPHFHMKAQTSWRLLDLAKPLSNLEKSLGTAFSLLFCKAEYYFNTISKNPEAVKYIHV